VLFLALFAAAALAQGPTRVNYLKHTLYNMDLLSAYISNPVDGPAFYLPPVDEEQLCYLTGAISGCSGCQWGTQDLCRWVGQTWPGGEFYQCLSRTASEDLISHADDVLAQYGVVIYDASYQCPAEAVDERTYTETLFTAAGLPIVPEVASLIHSTYHEMLFGDVEYKPWAVDRTALYSEHGAMNVYGLHAGLFLAAGDFVRPSVTCATLNDPEALSILVSNIQNPVCPNSVFPPSDETAGYHRVIDELVNGLLGTSNDVFCLEAIWGAYLSTRCPEYGVAISGISYSLYRSFVDNCSPSPWRVVNLGPTMVNLPGPNNSVIQIPFSIFGLPIVPDGTPFALDDITIPVSTRFEEWSEIDEIDEASSYNVVYDETHLGDFNIYDFSNFFCFGLGK